MTREECRTELDTVDREPRQLNHAHVAGSSSGRPAHKFGALALLPVDATRARYLVCSGRATQLERRRVADSAR